MALPGGFNYEIPDLPQHPVPAWRPDASRCALLVHDMQRYFLRAFAPDAPALRDTLTHTAQLIELCRRLGVPVFYTAQTGLVTEVPRGLQGELWGKGMSPVPEHTEIVPQLAPHEDDVVLVKHRYSAFAHSDFADQLRDAGRDQLLITGVYAHIGIVATAFDAFQCEVRPIIAADAVAAFSAADHQRALELLASCVANVLPTATILEDLVSEVSAPDELIRAALESVLSAELIDTAFEAPESDLFELGLDSVRAFEFLDVLADAGVSVDFGEFSRQANVAFLRTQSSDR